MQPTRVDQPSYPSHRAFVLQLHREADLAAGRFIGRIEQIVSGEVRHVQTLEELLAFLTERLGEA